MRVKALTIMIALALTASGGHAQTADSAKQWRITTLTAIGGGTPVSASISACIGPDDLRNPPKAFTGPVCAKQTYNLENNNLTWTGTCDEAKGKGNIVFAADGQSFSGDIQSMIHGLAVTSHVDGKVTGTCVKN